MHQLRDRAALLAAVQWLQQEIDQIIAEAEKRPDPLSSNSDGWTGKDVVAHLTSWRLRTAARLEAGLSGAPPTMPWPAPLDEDGDLDEINHWFFAQNRDKPWAEIRDESRDTFARVERAIAALPDQDLFEVDRFPWLMGYALGPAVVEGTLDHFEEHEPELRAWLAQE